MRFSIGIDNVGLFFCALFTFMWIVAGIYASKYTTHQSNNKRFYTCYIASYVMLVILCFAQNYFTMYLSFEFMTLISMPMVLHNGTDEAIAAAKKYLFYSIAGATLGLLGFFFSAQYCTTFDFVPGGSLAPQYLIDTPAVLLAAIFLAVVGFGAKAGLFPLHAWLPTAHPVAPAPASAVLSGVITKAGVLCIIRVIHFVFGPAVVRGTWVQYAWICLALLTVVMGSLMAAQQDLFKKRLAYSTVSQVSYVLFGIFTLNPIGMLGSMLHIIYHSVIKDCLFMSAGSVMFANHLHEGEPATELQIARSKALVSSFDGIGREMPITFACFTIASLGLVGVPPFAGFLSKWYLATGSLAEGIPVLSWLGPACLLASALLTAVYLLSISIRAYFPPKDKEIQPTCHEVPAPMLFSEILLAVLVVVLGVFAQNLVDIFNVIIAGFM